MRKLLWGTSNILLGLFIVAAAYTVLFERQNLTDWWRAQNFTPSPAVAALEGNIGLTPESRHLFRASQPVVEGEELFNQHCRDQDKETLILGCYSAQQIYIYDVTDPKLSGVKEVTAAHELLHASYERLDRATRLRVDEMVSAQMAKINDSHLQDLIKIYNETEPGELLNEMHSIIGTEYSNLAPELEIYYRQYFNNREKIVAYSDNYASVFRESKQRLADYDARLAELKQKIDTQTALMTTNKRALDQQSNELERLRNSDREAYNARVPQFNAQVRSYNTLVSTVQENIAKFNSLVITRNGEAAAQNNLYNSLNSNPAPKAQTQ